MGIESTSLVRVLKSMEEKGLICRKPTTEDKRKVIISLTELGKEKRLLAKEVVVKLNSEIQGQLSDEELSSFFNVMDKINNYLNTIKS